MRHKQGLQTKLRSIEAALCQQQHLRRCPCIVDGNFANEVQGIVDVHIRSRSSSTDQHQLVAAEEEAQGLVDAAEFVSAAPQ